MGGNGSPLFSLRRDMLCSMGRRILDLNDLPADLSESQLSSDKSPDITDNFFAPAGREFLMIMRGPRAEISC